VHLRSGQDPLEVQMASEPESRTFDVVLQLLLTHLRSRPDIIEENILSLANMLSVEVIRSQSVGLCEHLHTAMALYMDSEAIFVACCKAIIALQSRAEEILDYEVPQCTLDIL
jgi:hypothetical protein